MIESPDPYHIFDKRVVVLEERMNSMNAKNESAIDRMNTILADFKTKNAQRAEDTAKRETRLILTMGGMITIAVAILGILIRWPASPA